MSYAPSSQRQTTELACYLNYAPAAALRISPSDDLSLSAVVPSFLPFVDSFGLARVDRSPVTGQIRLIFTTATGAQKARQHVLANPINVGLSKVIDLEPIESAHSWPLAERLDNPRPHDQAVLIPALDPQSTLFDPDIIMWRDVKHCERWSAMTQAVCVPSSGFVSSPRMPLRSRSVVDFGTGAKRSLDMAGLVGVASTSKKAAFDGLSGSSGAATSSTEPVPASLPTLSRLYFYPLQPYGNIYDLVGGTAGLLDARMHSAKVNGAYWATARYDTPQHAQQALSTLQHRSWGGAPAVVRLWNSFGAVDARSKTARLTIAYSPKFHGRRIQRTDAEQLEQVLRAATGMQPEAVVWESYPDRGVHFFKLLYSSVEQVKQITLLLGGMTTGLSDGTATIPLDCDSASHVWDFGRFQTGSSGVTAAQHRT